MGLFHRETPKEKMRRYKRGLDHTCRDLDRERSKLQTQEKKIMMDMKRAAKDNQVDSVRIMARDLVRTRKYARKMYHMRTQIQGVSLRIQTMSSTAELASSMKGVTKAMKSMNKQMNIPEMQKIMREFEKENEQMGMKEEMMNDAIDDVMDDEGEEEEETELEIQKVMDEAGLDFRQKVGVTNTNLPQKESAEENDEDLDARLAALKATMK
ncbi:charged multivesicular body protein 2A [Angomonas deanei]|nr:charged multivesicular body protein 2A [Angomonas deanei]EPY40516.1 charged multivesicular body protein 2A [Angomonas deanei]|eukprot:EPY37656.1 charged multivesicular body protein 2A [Angomonas deanei]